MFESKLKKRSKSIRFLYFLRRKPVKAQVSLCIHAVPCPDARCTQADICYTGFWHLLHMGKCLIYLPMLKNLVALRSVVCFESSSTPTGKPVLSGHSKIDKTKTLMTNGSLMKVESAECSFCNTFDLH